MRAPYQSTYFPPAPVVEVRFAVPGESFSVGPIPALIDTGSDTTYVPTAYINLLQVGAEATRHIRDFGGWRRQVTAYVVDIGFGRLRLPGVEVVANGPQAEIILGRNVLNKLRILLDGPNLVLDIRD